MVLTCVMVFRTKLEVKQASKLLVLVVPVKMHLYFFIHSPPFMTHVFWGVPCPVPVQLARQTSRRTVHSIQYHTLLYPRVRWGTVYQYGHMSPGLDWPHSCVLVAPRGRRHTRRVIAATTTTTPCTKLLLHYAPNQLLLHHAPNHHHCISANTAANMTEGARQDTMIIASIYQHQSICNIVVRFFF